MVAFKPSKYWVLKKISFAFIGLFLLLVEPVKGHQIKNELQDDMDVQKWIGRRFAKGQVPPFSFSYGEKKSENFIRKWNYHAEKLESDNYTLKYIFTYREPERGLIVKCYVTGFKDLQAVEWVLKFSNASSNNTPILEKVQIVDQDFGINKEDCFTLQHIRGSKGGKDDYMPLEDTLLMGRTISLSPAGGRSSDATVVPFFNIKSKFSSGFVVAIGWTGKWYADICHNGESISLKAGMAKMKLILYPDEEIRSPSVCLLFWRGNDPMTGNNKFRKFVRIHKTRNNSLQLPISESLSPNSPSPCNGFFGCLSDTFAFDKIKKLKQINIVPDVCWIDAGWYQDGGDNWQITGNWIVEKKRFPYGLKPVSDAIHNAGAKFLLWFEPERVVEGTQLALEHKSWLIGLSGDKRNIYTGKKDYVFNLGLEEARLWLTDYISDFLKREGVDYFRQDFNIDPQNYWDANDLPCRIGISEIRHIEGLYAFWDSLLVRLPGLVIDNCASGGRRIDLESISRSSLLWRSDYLMDEPEGLQNHTFGLNFYLPFHGTGNLSYSPYEFRSALSSSMVLFWDIHNSENSIAQMQKCMSDFKRFSPYYSGDYYPLTGIKDILMDNIWLAYQLNRPENGDGIILAFRRKNCPERSITVKLNGLNKNADYELFNEDSGQRVNIKGEELIKGIELSNPEKKSSLLFVYKQIIKQ